MSGVKMTPQQATKRYMARVMGSAAGYIGAVFGAAFLIDDGDPITVVTILASLIPAIFIVLMMRALWRYIEDVDEVARHDFVQALMAAGFTVVTLSGSWGLVEMFNDDLPRLSIFWVFPVFFLVFGLVTFIRYRRCV